MTSSIDNNNTSIQGFIRPPRNPNRPQRGSKTAHTAATPALPVGAQSNSQTNPPKHKAPIAGSRKTWKLEDFASEQQIQALRKLEKSGATTLTEIDKELEAADNAVLQEVLQKSMLRPVSSEQRELQEFTHANLISSLSKTQNESQEFLATFGTESFAPAPGTPRDKKEISRQINASVETYLSSNGIQIIDSAVKNKESGEITHQSGNNCLIYSIVQQMINDGKQGEGVSIGTQRFVEKIREAFDTSHPALKNKMLDTDNLADLLPLIQKQFKVDFGITPPSLSIKCLSVHKNIEGQLNFMEAVNIHTNETSEQKDKQSIVLWHKDEHFVGIVATSQAKNSELFNPSATSPLQNGLDQNEFNLDDFLNMYTEDPKPLHNFQRITAQPQDIGATRRLPNEIAGAA